MFDKNKFRATVLLSGKSMKEIASALGINVATLYRKISGESDFYRNEIQTFCEITGVQNPSEIFFTQKVT